MVTNLIHVAWISWSRAFCLLKNWGRKWKCASSPHRWALYLERSAPTTSPMDRDTGSYGHSWFWEVALGSPTGGHPRPGRLPSEIRMLEGAQRGGDARMAGAYFLVGLKRILWIHTKSIRDEDKTAPTFPQYFVNFITCWISSMVVATQATTGRWILLPWTGKVGDLKEIFLLAFSDKLIQFSKIGMSGTKKWRFHDTFSLGKDRKI